MGLWQEVRDIFREEMTVRDLTDPTHAGARLRQFALLLRETQRSIRQDQAMTVANALAFKSLMAMVPILAICLAIVSMMGSTTGPDGGTIVYAEDFVHTFQAKIPDFPGKEELINSIRGFADNARAIAGVGFLFLFWTGYTLLSGIEDVFNQIWQVPVRRTVLQRMNAFVATIFIVPVLMSLSVYMTTRIAQASETVARSFPVSFISNDDESDVGTTLEADTAFPLVEPLDSSAIPNSDIPLHSETEQDSNLVSDAGVTTSVSGKELFDEEVTTADDSVTTREGAELSVSLQSGTPSLTSDISAAVTQKGEAFSTEERIEGADAIITTDSISTQKLSHAIGTLKSMKAANTTNIDAGKHDVSSASQPAKRQNIVTRIVLVIASLATTCLALSTLLYLLPNTRVRVRAALVGGVVAGIFFEAAKFLFRYYAIHLAGNYTQVYGTLLAIPIFLIWVYIVWVIVLVGAEVAFTVQNFRDLAARADLEKRGLSCRIYFAVRIVLRMCRYFHSGEKPLDVPERLADELRIPPYVVRDVLTQLERKDILRRVVPGEEAYLPAKDIALLNVQDVVDAISSESLDIAEEPNDAARNTLAALFGKTRLVTTDVLQGVTFASLIQLPDDLTPRTEG